MPVYIHIIIYMGLIPIFVSQIIESEDMDDCQLTLRRYFFIFWFTQILHLITRIGAADDYHFPDVETRFDQSMASLKKDISYLQKQTNRLIDSVNDYNPVSGMAGIVNPHPFSFTITNSHACEGTNVFLLVYVHTAPRNWKRRMMIRQTWGDVRQYTQHVVRVVFVLGTSTTDGWPNISESLALENDLYHDIVQENYIDSYRNLTYKAIGALRWIQRYCPQTKFVLKTDDDLFVNMFDLLQRIDEQYSSYSKTIFCMLWKEMKVCL